MTQPSRFGVQNPVDWCRSRLDRIEPKPDPSWGVSARYWANPEWSLICLVFLLFTAFLHPVHGFPVRFCLFYGIFGIDCPACGMTRAITNLWRGNLWEALRYHPFSPVAFAYLAGQSAYLFLPERSRWAVIRVLERYDLEVRVVWVSGLVSFFLYGTARAVIEALHTATV